MSDFENGGTFFPESSPEEPPKAPRSLRSERNFLMAGVFFEYVELVVITVCILLFAALFLFRHTVVDGDSMEPTLKNNEHLIITDAFYKPSVGDIVVFESYEETGLDEPLIKRVIATAGQTVRIDARAFRWTGYSWQRDRTTSPKTTNCCMGCATITTKYRSWTPARTKTVSTTSTK